MNIHQEEVIVSVRDLEKHFPVKLGAFGERSGVVHAIDGVSFDLCRGETLGLVGESGCGKSTTGFSVVQLHRVTRGSIKFLGTEITKLPEKQLRPMRKHMQIIFQDPYSTLNPRMTIGDTLAEPIKSFTDMDKQAMRERVSSLLTDVGLHPELANRYPHEFSGGQRQRICIARALAVEPQFIVCDEPVSALDVSVQSQIINLLQDLQDKYGLTYLFIAHNLAVVKHICNRIAVMYLGKIAELADKKSLFDNPMHPYTKALLSAVPEADPEYERRRKRIVLEGDVPDALNPPPGCRFHPRCPYAEERCRTEIPAMTECEPGHFVACHKCG